MFPKLDELLKYENKDVIARYQRDYPNAKMPAKQAFSELLKFIWLCLKHQHDKAKFPSDENLNFTCVMHSEMTEIDNVWHTFLLFTKDYHEFCSKHLNGIFFHHNPMDERVDNSPAAKMVFKKELTHYLSYIHENLGEDTLKSWFGMDETETC